MFTTSTFVLLLEESNNKNGMACTVIAVPHIDADQPVLANQEAAVCPKYGSSAPDCSLKLPLDFLCRCRGPKHLGCPSVFLGHQQTDRQKQSNQGQKQHPYSKPLPQAKDEVLPCVGPILNTFFSRHCTEVLRLLTILNGSVLLLFTYTLKLK